MDKKYQVFVSSTYADLEEERKEVMQALLELDCMPAGMELFPATNEDQWSLIKRIIDDSDYYIVILAGRYGSIGPQGISYTEMEYRYAMETGKPIIGFLHKNKGALPSLRCESSDEGKQKLDEFESLVKKKLCRFWDTPSELGSQVSRSLIRLIKDNPAIGWVKGNLIASDNDIKEILRLRKQIEELQNVIDSSLNHAPEGTEDLSKGDDLASFNYIYKMKTKQFGLSAGIGRGEFVTSWNVIFSYVSPYMIQEISDYDLNKKVDELFEDKLIDELRAKNTDDSKVVTDVNVTDSDFQTIKIQFRALGLIIQSESKRSLENGQTYWTLTNYGSNLMTTLRAVRNK
ncbi:DUF4062 domain-containing protein [Enterobacter ludwigii]